MAVVRCPRCGKAFERTPHVAQVCPNCGLRAPVAEPEERIVPDTLVARAKPTWLVFLTSFLLPLLAYPFWLLVTFRNLDRQHGRHHPWILWSLMPALVLVTALFLLLFALDDALLSEHALLALLAYFLLAAPAYLVLVSLPYLVAGFARLRRSRRARGLRRGMGFLTPFLVALAGGLLALAYLLLVHLTYPSIGHAFDVAAMMPGNFETDRLGSGEAWAETLSGLGVLTLAVAALPTALLFAIALTLVNRAANKLWRAIYEERGEPWPWRTAKEIDAMEFAPQGPS